MEIHIPKDFKKARMEEFDTYIANCSEFIREGWADGYKYYRNNGEYFAAKLDNGECYTKYMFWIIGA